MARITIRPGNTMSRDKTLQPPRIHGRLCIAVLAICLSSAGMASAAKVSLAWDPPTPDNGVVGYKVHYGSSSREYTCSVDVGNITTWTIDGLNSSATYYFSITSYNNSGNESGYSAELVWDNVPPTISGPEEISMGTQPSSPNIVMPDLRKYISTIDDFSPNSSISISQSPAPGTSIQELPPAVIFFASDEAGNRAARIISLTAEVITPALDSTPSMPKLSMSMTSGGAVVTISFPDTSEFDVAGLQHIVTLEQCTNLCTAEWTVVPGYENITANDRVALTYQASADLDMAFFRIQSHLE